MNWLPERFRNYLSRYLSRISGANEKVERLEGEVSGLREERNGLEGQVEGLQEEVRQLEQGARVLQGRNAEIDRRNALLEEMLSEANETIGWEIEARQTSEKKLIEETAFREKYEQAYKLMDEEIVTSRQVKRAAGDCVADVITRFSKDSRKMSWESVGVNAALVRKAIDSDRKAKVYSNEHANLQRRFFDYVAMRVCEEEGVQKAPAFIYAMGEIYITEKFGKKVGSGHKVKHDLKDDYALCQDINDGRRTDVEYGKGRLFFVPVKTRDGLVFSVGYYVPHGSKRSKVFGNLGEEAVKVIKGVFKHLELGGKLQVA